MLHKKPILVAPYHDPNRVFFGLLIKKIPLLKEIFGEVCISITPDTCKRHPSIPSQLKKAGCYIKENNTHSVISDHFGNGLELYRKNIGKGNVYYGFFDRILFALNSLHRKAFIADVSKRHTSDMLIFSRSPKAWKTHPKDYYISEKIVEDIGFSLFGKRWDWAWCGAALSEKAVGVICSKKSDINDFAIETDWILSCMKEECTISNKEVDWLSWEDPFWAKR